jgi:hypothetical protein
MTRKGSSKTAQSKVTYNYSKDLPVLVRSPLAKGSPINFQKTPKVPGHGTVYLSCVAQVIEQIFELRRQSLKNLL